MGSSTSCHSRQGNSRRNKNRFNSPTLTCSDPRSSVFPRNTPMLDPIELSDSDDSRGRYGGRRRRRSSSSGSSQRRGSPYYHRSTEAAEEDALQIRRHNGSAHLSVKVPGKTVPFANPGAPRDNKSTKSHPSYNNSRDHRGNKPWADATSPPEHVPVTYRPRRRDSRRRRRYEADPWLLLRSSDSYLQPR